MKVTCPRCSTLSDFPNEVALSEVVCPDCGSSFDIDPFAGTIGGPGIQSPMEVEPIKLGQFELIEKVGEGAFGTVWKARDVKLDRTVAIKLPRRDLFDDGLETEKFLREARAAAGLRHPNIVTVHEIGQVEDRVFIVSDFIEGETLKEWLAKQPSGNSKPALTVCAKIADALHYAHEAGVVHRDLKPSNIMVDAANEPHLMDFGLARRENSDATLTLDGQILGTPNYMSPEQARGEGHSAGRSSDIYSLGVVLFETSTGKLPFRGKLESLLDQIQHHGPPRPRSIRKDISRDLETVCLKALEKLPGDRFSTAAEFGEELNRILRGEPIATRPVGMPIRCWRWCRRNPVSAGLSGLLIAALILVGALAWQKNRSLPDPANMSEALPIRWNVELRDFVDAISPKGWDTGIGRILYGEMAASIDAGREGEWTIGSGLTADGLPHHISLDRDGSFTGSALTIAEAKALDLTELSIQRTNDAGLEIPLMEFAALKDIQVEEFTALPGKFQIEIQAVSEVFTDVEVRDLRAVFEMDFTEGTRSGTREIRAFLGLDAIPSGPINFSFEMSEEEDQQLEWDRPARLYIEGFVLMGNPKVYRITNSVALDLNPDER